MGTYRQCDSLSADDHSCRDDPEFMINSVNQEVTDFAAVCTVSSFHPMAVYHQT